MEAGAGQADGSYPPETINYRVDQRLGLLAQSLRTHDAPENTDVAI